MTARRFRTLYSLGLVVIDAALLVLTLYTAFKLRVLIDWPSDAVDMPSRFLLYTTTILPAYLASNAIVFFYMRLYHVPRATSRCRSPAAAAAPPARTARRRRRSRAPRRRRPATSCGPLPGRHRVKAAWRQLLG